MCVFTADRNNNIRVQIVDDFYLWSVECIFESDH